MQPKIISILVLDDSLPFRNIVQQAISGEPGLCLLSETGAGTSLEQVLKWTSPDVIILSEISPPVGGSLSESLNMLSPSSSTDFAPCIVIGPECPGTIRTAGEHDAEFIKLPSSHTSAGMVSFRNEVCTKIKLAANAADVMRISAGGAAVKRPSGADFRYHVIAVGASTGGTEATAQIMESLPANMPGIVITQHMPPDFTRMYAERLDRISNLSVSEAKNGDRVKPGTAVVAAGGLQMYLKKDSKGYYVQCAQGEKVNGHRPSVGVLFDSVAQCAGKDAIGVILTGMGNDGAEGLLRMRKAGAYTIGQDKQTCVVYGMPMVAYQIGAVMQQAPVDRIANILMGKVR